MSGPGSLRIVINADDLGREDHVNQAILDAFDRDLITSASIMTNMPGFEAAVSMVGTSGVRDRIGVHLNMTQGSALTQPIREHPRFCRPSGELEPRGPTIWRLSRDERRAIEAELAAQIEALIGRGIRPTHLDSHQHFHTQWPICPIVVSLARRYDIPAVRLSRNCGPRPSPIKQAYKAVFNARLRRTGLAPTRHFGSAPDVAALRRFSGPVEIMVHPELDATGHMVNSLDHDTGAAEPLEPVASTWRQLGTLVSFRELTA